MTLYTSEKHILATSAYRSFFSLCLEVVLKAFDLVPGNFRLLIFFPGFLCPPNLLVEVGQTLGRNNVAFKV